MFVFTIPCTFFDKRKLNHVWFIIATCLCAITFPLSSILAQTPPYTILTTTDGAVPGAVVMAPIQN